VAWTSDALDPDALIARADSAMYESKRLGRQGVTLCNASSDSGHPIAL
jgi:PleD family two-component response regulator